MSGLIWLTLAAAWTYTVLSLTLTWCYHNPTNPTD